MNLVIIMNPPPATAAARSAERHRRPAPHRLDLFPQRRRLAQSGALQLFNCFNYRPPIIGFASTGWKDSVANIVETGEFVWNLATRPLAEAMNNSSITLPRGEDEFAFAGVTPLPGRRVKAERVAESPVNFECRLTQCIQLQTAAGEQVETWLILGEVVAVHLDPALLDEHGVYQTAAAEPILRAGGPTAYYGISEQHRFDLARPTR